MLNSSPVIKKLIETLKYFWRRFIIETKIPNNRFTLDINNAQSLPMNGDASITREEYAFARFIYRLQSIFQEILIRPTWMLFCIKHPEFATNEILKSYETNGKKREVISQISMNFEETSKNDDNYDIIKKTLDEINPLNISPMEALNILYDLKNKIDARL